MKSKLQPPAILLIVFALFVGSSHGLQTVQGSCWQSSSKTQQEDDKQDSDNKSKQESEPAVPWASRSKYSKQKDANFVSVFDPVIANISDSTVRIMVKKKQLALGTVIAPEGLLLTKASEIRPGMEIEIDQQRYTPKVVGIHPESDLALLQVEAEGLVAVQWSDDSTPPLGRWVASPKAMAKNRPAIGIVSTKNVRHIPPSRPFIGIMMQNKKKGGVVITHIVAGSPAEFAGLRKRDIIKNIGGVEVTTTEELIKAVGQYDVGDRIAITLMRKKKEKIVKLSLIERDRVSPENMRSNQQNSMGSVLSRRRKDFPKAFQHDSMLNSNTCGGPIVDLSGKAVGVNIARAGRVSSLALPVESVLPVIDILKTGSLAPEVVNRRKIEQLRQEILEVTATINRLPEKKNVLNVRYNRERARLEELERFAKDYRNRVQEMEKLIKDYQKTLEGLEERRTDVKSSAKKFKKELDDLHRNLRKNERVKERLENDLEGLITGSKS